MLDQKAGLYIMYDNTLVFFMQKKKNIQVILMIIKDR